MAELAKTTKDCEIGKLKGPGPAETLDDEVVKKVTVEPNEVEHEGC